jgi:hypothetical protein
MNKYTVKLPNAVLATDDTNNVTGNQSARWQGALLKDDGDTTNFLVGDSLVFMDSIVTNSTSTYLSKMVSLKVGTVENNKDGAIQIPLSTLEFSEGVDILGMLCVGISGANDKSYSIRRENTLTNHIEFLISKANKSLIVVFNKAITTGVNPITNQTINIIIYYR